MLIQGDCLDKLKELPENSIDSIVTDPPYELGFMGKSWDSSGIANNVEMWAECLRVLKPGGNLLSFGGTRTYHRMASTIEDAGFEIRDMIEWVYGSGFPKSLNIGKAVDKIHGNERKDLGEHPYAARRPRTKIESNSKAFDKGTIGTNRNLTNTKGTSEWEGWGTALKPAHEPICMARKPLAEKTVAENVLKYGTGGINIDESRVGTEGARFNGRNTNSNIYGKYGKDKPKEVYNYGRFPTNLIHDGSEEVVEFFPNESERFFKSINEDKNQWKSLIYKSKASKSERNKGCEGLEEIELRGGGGRAKQGYDDRDPEQKRLKDAAQAYGAVKAKKFNFHPTVKPIALMEYLIKMVTPKGGTVLDPFMGSGSTGVAAKLGGFNFIGIEMEEEYLKIAKSRINA